jgi:hypothetical protein
MGQPVTVIEKPSSSTPGVVRYETNRTLTGTGHEIYRAGEPVVGAKWCDELARRLFERDGIATVHMNGSVITVRFEPGARPEGLRELIEEMFIYYRPGVEVVIPEGTAAD